MAGRCRHSKAMTGCQDLMWRVEEAREKGAGRGMWELNCLVYARADVATQWTSKPKEKVSEHKPNTIRHTYLPTQKGVKW